MTSLPVCRWRAEPTGDGRHMCMSPKLVVGACGVPDAGCASCPCRDHEPPARGRGQCVHLGRRIGMTQCPGCTAAAGRPVEVPLHACAVHGSCTIERHSPGIARCAECSAHRPAWRRDEAGAIRHLTYHIYPRGEIWSWNIAQLRQRMSLFNGRRLVAVATDGMSDTACDVAEALTNCGVTIIPLVNDCNKREMVSHPQLLERMSDLASPADVTFYGHAKGIGSSLVADGVRRWAEEMYRANLDYWPAVQRALRDYAAVGIMRRRTRHPPGVPIQWHFAGSFRWLRNADLYCRDWRRIDEGWMGPETYPGRHIRYEESCTLYGECASGGWGYSMAEWEGAWRGEVADAWRAAHVHDLQQPMLMTILIRAHAHPERVHDAIASVRAQTSSEWVLVVMSSGRPELRGLAARYADDARITVIDDPQGPPVAGEPSRAARRLNECWADGRIVGDLVMYLPDDDLMSPHTVATMIARARAQSEESAWYGSLDVHRVRPNGQLRALPPLQTVGVLRPGNGALGRVDGLQVCHRRSAWTAWPADPAVEAMVDGVWIDQLAAQTPVIPLGLVVGTQRHTPDSTYTQ
jgi:hypothetical protein